MQKQTNPVDMTIGQRVADRRIALGMNQSSLGRALGLSFQQVQKYETGMNRIAVSRLWAIAKALDVNVSYFFDDQTLDQGAPFVTSPSRQSREVMRLMNDLPVDDQKLILALTRKIHGSDDVSTD